MSIVDWFKFVILLLINTVALIGNTLMIIVGCKSKSLRKFQNAFIFNMAIADVLQSILIMPSALVNLAYQQPTLRHGWCDLFAATKVAVSLVSVYSLAGVSIQRYFFVVRHTKKMNSAKSATLGISFVWAISVLFSLTPFMGWGELGFEDGKEVCTALFHVTLSHTVVIFTTALFLNVAVMVFCYCCIFLTLRNSNVKRVRTAQPIITSTSESDDRPLESKPVNKNSRASLSTLLLEFCKFKQPNKGTDDTRKIGFTKSIKLNKTIKTRLNTLETDIETNKTGTKLVHDDSTDCKKPSNEWQVENIELELKESINCSFTNKIERSDSYHVTKFTNKEIRLLKTIVVVVAIFVCCWTPYVLYNICRAFGVGGNNNVADGFTMWLGFLNSALNPIFYGVLNQQFRKAMVNVVKCR